MSAAAAALGERLLGEVREERLDEVSYCLLIDLTVIFYFYRYDFDFFFPLQFANMLMGMYLLHPAAS